MSSGFNRVDQPPGQRFIGSHVIAKYGHARRPLAADAARNAYAPAGAGNQAHAHLTVLIGIWLGLGSAEVRDDGALYRAPS